MGYTKLFSDLIHSTVWTEEVHIKIVWVTMLAMSDDRHEVRASIPGLAKAAGVSLEDCQDALRCFMSPDEYSRSQEFEGRRIEEVDGGWRLLNGSKYRAMRSAEERREYLRKWKADKRASDKKTNKSQPKQKKETNPSKIEGVTFPKYIDKKLWEEWMDIRKKKKAINSDTALKAIISKLDNIEKSGKHTANEAITKAIENSWKSVQLEWMGSTNDRQQSNKPKTGHDIMHERISRIKRDITKSTMEEN